MAVWPKDVLVIPLSMNYVKDGYLAYDERMSDKTKGVRE